MNVDRIMRRIAQRLEYEKPLKLRTKKEQKALIGLLSITIDVLEAEKSRERI